MTLLCMTSSRPFSHAHLSICSDAKAQQRPIHIPLTPKPRYFSSRRNTHSSRSGSASTLPPRFTTSPCFVPTQNRSLFTNFSLPAASKTFPVAVSVSSLDLFTTSPCLFRVRVAHDFINHVFLASSKSLFRRRHRFVVGRAVFFTCTTFKMVSAQSSRCSSVSSELGRLSPQRSRMSVTPPPSTDYEEPDFTEDNILLAEYPGNFRELITNPQLQDGLADGNIQQLDGIQGVFIRHCLKRRDIVCQLPAKSGKTAIFVLASLQMLNLEERDTKRAPSVVVVAPTRELAEQIYQTYLLYGKRMAGLNVKLFVGGMGKAREDMQGLIRCPQQLHVVVATPGRLRELISRHYVHLHQIKLFICDEADRIMADVEMRHDVHQIFTKTDIQKQTWMFSATFSGISREICLRYLRLPYSWNGPSIANPRRLGVINHRFYHCHENSKIDYLEGFLNLISEREPERQVLIFVDTRDRCQQLLNYLEEKNFDVIQIQGDLKQQIRFYCFGLAKENKKKLVVTTDLCARGLDIGCVSVVVNFDCPKGFSGNQNGGRHDPVEARDTYLHRTNRCGRDIEQSLVLTLARDAGDIQFLRTEVEQNLGIEVLQLL